MQRCGKNRIGKRTCAKKCHRRYIKSGDGICTGVEPIPGLSQDVGILFKAINSVLVMDDERTNLIIASCRLQKAFGVTGVHQLTRTGVLELQ